MTTLRILHEDRNALVIDKPPGLAVHPGPRTPDSLEALLPDLVPRGRFVPQPVHRLDRDTSGCLLLGRTRGAVKEMGSLFASRAVGKTYWSVVEGEVIGHSGVVDAPLRKLSSPTTGWRMVIDPAGQPARTAWTVLARGAGRSLVEFRPETGRTHQIRVHATQLGRDCSLLGDPVYGRAGGRATVLHARRLDVPAMRQEPSFSVVAPLPASFSRELSGWASVPS